MYVDEYLLSHTLKASFDNFEERNKKFDIKYTLKIIEQLQLEPIMRCFFSAIFSLRA